MKLRHVLAVPALFAAVDSHAALIHQYGLTHSQTTEPASALLLLCGLGMLAIARRRRLA